MARAVPRGNTAASVDRVCASSIAFTLQNAFRFWAIGLTNFTAAAAEDSYALACARDREYDY